MRDPKQRRILPHARPVNREAADLEVQHHVEERVDQLIAEGWDREAAEREAWRRFGDASDIKREMLTSGGKAGPWSRSRRGAADLVREIGRDLRVAARVLRRSPVFTVTAALTLAVAIAGNATIFSLVNATLLRPLPFPDADRLMRAFIRLPDNLQGEGMRNITWSYPKYEMLRDRQDVFEALSLFRATRFTLPGDGGAERIDGEIVSDGYLPMLGIEPVVGRSFLPEENAVPERDYVAMLGYDLWTRRYDRDPRVVGQDIHLSNRGDGLDPDARPYRIVGVLPEGFEGLTGGAEIWVPIMTLPAAELQSHGSHNKHVLARLRPGVTPDEAKAVVARLGREINEVYPGGGAGADEWTAGAVLLSEERMDPAIRKSMLFIFGAAGLLLLIACVNVANLLLARASARRREVAVRKAMGAGRGRIVRQLLAESGLLAVVGGGAGLALSYWGVGLVGRVVPVAIGDAQESIFRGAIAGLTDLGLGSVRFDGSVVLFAGAVAVLSVVLFGLVPALHGAGGDLNQPLRDGGRRSASTGPARGILNRRTLVTAELALTFALLVGAGLMLRSVDALLTEDRGFEAEGVLSGRIVLPSSRYDRESAAAFFTALGERLEALPGVDAVGRNQCLPLSAACDGTNIAILSDGEEAREDITVGIHWTNPAYFTALDIAVVRGRVFTAQDRPGTPAVALVSEAAASRYWPGGNPLASRLAVGSDTMDVVGVVADVPYESLERDPAPQVYLPVAQDPRMSAYLAIRARTEPTTLAPAVRRVLRELDPGLPLTDVHTLAERVGDATSRQRFGADLLTLFAVVGLILAAIGIYGVVAFGVAQQMHDIGVRVAIGADRGDVMRMVVGRGVRMAVVGILLGLGLVFALKGILDSVLYGVGAFDVATVVGTAVLLATIATAASWLPARRAVAVDPTVALRAE